MEFLNTPREINRADRHSFGQLFAHNVYNKLGRSLNVARGILQDTARFGRASECQDWRIVCQDVEEAVWRRIHPTVLIE